MSIGFFFFFQKKMGRRKETSQGHSCIWIEIGS